MGLVDPAYKRFQKLAGFLKQLCVQAAVSGGPAMDTLLTDELWNTITLYLPEHAPSPKGGRPRVPDRDCLRGILFVLREGLRWQSLPKERGCGSGSTCWRRFREWAACG